MFGSATHTAGVFHYTVSNKDKYYTQYKNSTVYYFISTFRKRKNITFSIGN